MNGPVVMLETPKRNPDVLSCIANLSNDEVFTPPTLAGEILDGVAEAWSDSNDGADIWADSSLKFFDPFTKSGVFLREITARLTAGLEDEIPNLGTRVDHILTNQVFGIAITRLTGLIARRSLYCSKAANGRHSIATSLDTEDGNIWFQPGSHSWSSGTCDYCGASQKVLDKGDGLESHAYAFIHTHNIKERVDEIFGGAMQFDVIVGNPPYQLHDGGYGASAKPIYNLFVEQAKALEPRLLTMIIPARWYAGGKGLESFRKAMLGDDRIRKLVDYPDSRACFQGVDVAGGICYFLWERDNPGPCTVVSHSLDEPSEASRPLLEPGADVFVRSNEGVSLLRKVFQAETEGDEVTFSLPGEKRFANQVSRQKPFGLRTFFRGNAEQGPDEDVLVLQSGGRGWMRREDVPAGVDLIDKWKVYTSKSSSEHAGQVDKNGQRRVLSLTGVLPPGSVVTETYVLLGTYDSEAEARNTLSYVLTKFFRFLIAMRSSAQDISRAAYGFIPVQDFATPWSDERLIEKYRLDAGEVDLINRTVRPMTAADD